jgi:phosphoglycolate phosphatase-like HAD superfamily hydrolase
VKNLPITDIGVLNVFRRLEMIVLDYDLSAVINDTDFYETFCNTLREFGEKCISFNEFSKQLESDTLKNRIPRMIHEDYFWRRFRQSYISRHSFPRTGLREFLLLMRNLGIKIVVISGRETHPEYIWSDLRRHGIDELIDDVITMHTLPLLSLREEFLFDKTPLIEHAKRKYSVLGEFICIGDYVTDYYSCIKAGGVFIGIGSAARTSILKKAGVSFIAENFYEVLLRLWEAAFI